MIAALAVLSLVTSSQSTYRDRFPIPGLRVPDGLGVCLRLRETTDGDLDLIKSLGAKWIRLDIQWKNVEQAKGHYDFSAYDPVVEGLAKRGLRAVFILGGGNSLYEVDSPRTREGRAAFAAFARTTVARYRSRGVLWEVWNEPNHPRFWYSDPSADEYAALVRVVASEIRKVAPEQYVVGPGTSRFDWAYLEKFIDRGALGFLDVISVHPYRDSRLPETVLDEWPRFRRLIDDNSAAFKPMISSEWGYPTSSKWHSTGTQPLFATRTYLLNLASGVSMSMWFAWRDRPDARIEGGRHHGLVNGAGKPKPAFRSLQSLVNQLEGFTCVGRVDMGSPRNFGVAFTKGSLKKIVMWTTDSGKRVVALPSRAARLAGARSAILSQMPSVFQAP